LRPWLQEHAASPQDTVFLESLGYIGYFSQLKTYDFPGLSSPEVVAARRKVGDDWARIVRLLKHSWLVLRPSEIRWIQSNDPTLLEKDYFAAKVFDVGQALQPYAKLPGMAALGIDQTFVVFHRRG
jgi:hypothetical protein